MNKMVMVGVIAGVSGFIVGFLAGGIFVKKKCDKDHKVALKNVHDSLSEQYHEQVAVVQKEIRDEYEKNELRSKYEMMLDMGDDLEAIPDEEFGKAVGYTPTDKVYFYDEEADRVTDEHGIEYSVDDIIGQENLEEIFDPDNMMTDTLVIRNHKLHEEYRVVKV